MNAIHNSTASMALLQRDNKGVDLLPRSCSLLKQKLYIYEHYNGEINSQITVVGRLWPFLHIWHSMCHMKAVNH